ncbi:unnamed protein product, partial [Toxocara canis]|uniref:Protein shisa-5 n=1 Tax=Toxocara canis TaxID=6265 RepID=A0A183UD66_TOXCA
PLQSSFSGFPAYCPRATDPDEYTYCCTYGYDWSMPTCCRYPLHAGLIYALCVGAFIVAAVLIFLSCWFCPLCPFAVRAHKVAKERNSRKIRQLLNDPDIFEDSYKPAYFR